MTERALFFDAEGDPPDREYSAGAWAAIFGTMFDDGVVKGHRAELEVTSQNPEDMSVRVRTGAAWADGRFYELYNETETINVAAPASGSRIDLIVVRVDYTTRTINVAKVDGAAAADPVAPAATQDSSTYEIPLAEVRVASDATAVYAADITDVRDWSLMRQHGQEHNETDKLNHGSLDGLGGQAHPDLSGKAHDHGGISVGANPDTIARRGENGVLQAAAPENPWDVATKGSSENFANSRYATNEYQGDGGSATREINCGFKPSLVIISGPESGGGYVHSVSTRHGKVQFHEDGTIHRQDGYDATTDNGFTVGFLNNSGQMYVYAAFR